MPLDNRVPLTFRGFLWLLAAWGPVIILGPALLQLARNRLMPQARNTQLLLWCACQVEREQRQTGSYPTHAVCTDAFGKEATYSRTLEGFTLVSRGADDANDSTMSTSKASQNATCYDEDRDTVVTSHGLVQGCVD